MLLFKSKVVDKKDLVNTPSTTDWIYQLYLKVWWLSGSILQLASITRLDVVACLDTMFSYPWRLHVMSHHHFIMSFAFKEGKPKNFKKKSSYIPWLLCNDYFWLLVARSRGDHHASAQAWEYPSLHRWDM